ncbi:outer membrane protein assembly factor BamB [Actinoplanes lutulentus]|uniref:Outer membrane protein assembly factor BamB n=1 Tax=Actinoplanes lutulentus TaxID=1287878 RepID=A0A327ZCS8_9ACTN|nr:PQQ-binding-like beta-propeller repeat protein [Actinoplanes lutulentus]MBB2945761.1 outer membrane protein assembly factor BamB [Actinoplanes lutulentus]RAK37810.1 outer membrane protein assembly factor BamB [Actinoplanes lutulentus]
MSSVLVTALVAVLTLPLSGPPSEWTQPGYGPGATFYNPLENGLDPSKLVKRWEIPTHGSPECEIGREPLIAGGNVYSSAAGGFAAFDPATGARRWFTKLVRRGITRMAIADGKIVTLTYTCDGQGSFLTAFSATTGTRLWEVPIGGPAQDMVVDRGVAVVDTRPDYTLSTTGYRLGDGGRLWRLTGTRGDGLLSSGGRLLLRTNESGARAVDIKTGGTVWQTTQNWYAVGSDPAGTRFYVSGTGGALAAVNAANGSTIWKSDVPSPGVTADDKRVYLPRYRSVLCLDAGTGRKLWSVHLPDAAGQPVRAGALLFSPSGIDSPLSIVDAVTGRAMKGGMPSDQHYPPAVAGGRLFLTDGDRLRAYF